MPCGGAAPDRPDMPPLLSPIDLAAAAEIFRDGEEPRRALCLALVRVLRADTVALWELRDGMLELTATGANMPAIAAPVAPGPGSAAGRAVAGGLRFFTADAPHEPDADARLVRQLGLRSLLSEPIRTGATVTGAIVVGWRRIVTPPDELTSALVALMVTQAATAMDRADLADRLSHEALTDPLTGLWNRRGLARELDRELARATRRSAPLAVALMDLDQFKAFNDEHGHAEGDQLLVRAARAWTARVRVQDALARWGGEEFVLLLPDCPPSLALEVAERVRVATPGDQTASVGLATWDGQEPAEALLARADAALYAAKEAGRDRALAG